MEIKRRREIVQELLKILSEKAILSSVDDALSLIGDLSCQKFAQIIIYEKGPKQIFRLKIKIAGDILQKFNQYQIL